MFREQFYKTVSRLDENKWWSIPISYGSTFLFIYLAIYNIIIQTNDIETKINLLGQEYDRRIIQVIIPLVLTPHIILLIFSQLRKWNISNNNGIEKLLGKLLVDLAKNAELGKVSDGRNTIQVIKKFFDNDLTVKFDALSTTKVLEVQITNWLTELQNTSPSALHELTEEAIIAYAEISKKCKNVAHAKNLVSTWNTLSSTNQMKENINIAVKKAQSILT